MTGRVELEVSIARHGIHGTMVAYGLTYEQAKRFVDAMNAPETKEGRYARALRPQTPEQREARLAKQRVYQRGIRRTRTPAERIKRAEREKERRRLNSQALRERRANDPDAAAAFRAKDRARKQHDRRAGAA